MYSDELFNLLSLVESIPSDECTSACETLKNADWRLALNSIKTNINQLIAVFAVLLSLFIYYKRKHNK